MATKTIPFDAAEHLKDPEDKPTCSTMHSRAATPRISPTRSALSRARGMTEVARGAGVSREALYKAFSDRGDPKLSTLVGVLKTLKIKLSARPETRARKIRKTNSA